LFFLTINLHLSFNYVVSYEKNFTVTLIFQAKKLPVKSETVVDSGGPLKEKVQNKLVPSSAAGSAAAAAAYSLAGQVGLADRAGEQLELPADQVDRADVTLAGLADCRVRLAGCPSTLHISNVK
jgi:hypothetical protein